MTAGFTAYTSSYSSFSGETDYIWQLRYYWETLCINV